MKVNIFLLKLIILLGICFCQSYSFAQKDSLNLMNSGILYGENHTFGVSAPSGWVLDNSSGVSQGVHAVFYPEGGSWENSITVMYANGADIDSTMTLEKFIEQDKKTFIDNYSGIKIEKLEPILTKDDKQAVVYKFYGGSYKNYEIVAYVKESHNISMMVITSRDEEDFKKSYPKFKELVSSYFYIPYKLNIDTR